jgi:hypothetical protein
MAKKKYEVVIEKVYVSRQFIEVDVEDEIKDNPKRYSTWYEGAIVADIAEKRGLFDESEDFNHLHTYVVNVNDENGEPIYED